MNVFVTGATGYIGNAVASALSRAGHVVYGLTRKKDSLAGLSAQEIRPVHGDLHFPDTIRATIEACSLIVHCAIDCEADTYRFEQELVRFFAEVGADSGDEKRLIFTSSTWIYGDTADDIVNERFSPSPPPFLRIRASTEQMVLECNQIAGTVIRPGWVYGEYGGMTAQWFVGAAQDGFVTVVGDGRNVLATIHKQDLADAYLRIAEQGFSSEIFDIVDYGHDRVGVLADAVGRVLNVRFPTRYLSVGQAAAKYGDKAYGMNLSQRIDSNKARRFLNWEPRHRGLGENIELYIAAWKAVTEKEIRYEEVGV